MMRDTASAEVRDGRRAWYGLGVLTLITVFAYIDRQVFVLLAEPVKRELLLSDFQLGLLQGVGLSIFAAIAVYPLGWLADRYDRRFVMAGCIAVWSVAVAACGFAADFTHLFIAGAIVGAGEAGLSPITLALLPELFRRRLQPANSVYSAATVLGPALAVALCGQLFQAAGHIRSVLPAAMQGLSDWRLTFLLAASPAPLFIVAMLTVPIRRRDRPAGLPRVGTEEAGGPTMRQWLRGNGATCWSFALGMGAAFFGFSALTVWIPVAAIRLLAMTPTDVGNMLGLATVVAIAVGLAVTTFGSTLLRRRFGAAMPVAVLAAASLIGAAVLLLLLPAASNATQLFLALGLYLCVMMTAQMYFPTAIQAIAPMPLRGRMVALARLFYWTGGAISPPLVGWLSDRTSGTRFNLLDTTVAVGVTGMILSGILLGFCGRSYARTAAEAEAIDATL
jgi:MFS family permease